MREEDDEAQIDAVNVVVQQYAWKRNGSAARRQLNM